MFSGSMVALVTPFKNGQVDWQSLEALVEFHLQNGTHGIVPCGTTGESATLSHAGARRCHSHGDQGGQQTHSRDRRHRFQFHRRGGAPYPRSREVRRRRRADDLALLQPADPGRHLSTLQKSRLRSRHSDHRLQYSRAAPVRRSSRKLWRGWPKSTTSPASKKPPARSIKPST